MSSASLGKTQDPISKITGAKSTAGMAQAVELLPRKIKVLSLNPSTTHTKMFLCEMIFNSTEKLQKQ
jgi:hypothetical protein